jgi:hypothetical protein
MNLKKESLLYLVVIFVLFGLSVGVTHYRYVVQQDFVYFSLEDSIPSQFDLSSYFQP